MHGVAQRLKTVDQASRDVLFVALIEEARTGIGVFGFIGEQVIGNGQDGVANRDDRFLLTAASDEPVVLRAEVGVPSAAAGVRGLDKGGPQPNVTFARLASLALASTLVVAGAHASPGRQVSRGRESRHVQPDLGHENLSNPSTDAGDGIQAVHGIIERAQALLDFDIELLDEFIQAVQMGELAGQQEALVCAELADQRTLQVG